MNIMVAIDFDQGAASVARHARHWAERLGGRLHLRGLLAEREPADARRLLAELGAAIGAAGDHELLSGPAVAALVGAVEGFDLVVVGGPARREGSRLEGSLAGQLVRKVPEPVLVVPSSDPTALPARLQVLVAVDDLEHALPAVEHAHRWLGRGASLHLVHVERDAPPAPTHEPSWVWPEAERLRGCLSDLGIEAELHGVLTLEPPAPQIAAVSRELGADLVVVRTHGATGLAHLLQGSVVEQLLHLVDRPVLALS